MLFVLCAYRIADTLILMTRFFVEGLIKHSYRVVAYL